MVSALKRVLSLGQIAAVLKDADAHATPQCIYDTFCEKVEDGFAAAYAAGGERWSFSAEENAGAEEAGAGDVDGVDGAAGVPSLPVLDAAIRTLVDKLAFECILARELGDR